METNLPAIRTSGENLSSAETFPGVYRNVVILYHICYFCGAVSTVESAYTFTHQTQASNNPRLLEGFHPFASQQFTFPPELTHVLLNAGHESLAWLTYALTAVHRSTTYPRFPLSRMQIMQTFVNLDAGWQSLHMLWHVVL
jgi:hypothetical protein